MKHISASIIVLAGSALLIAGAYHHHGDTGLFLTAVGCVVGVIGLIGWFTTSNDRDATQRHERDS